MELKAYKKLKPERRLSLVWSEGTFVDSYVGKRLRINLYSLFKFFVEVHYNAESNEIVDFDAFVEGGELDFHTRALRLDNI